MQLPKASTSSGATWPEHALEIMTANLALRDLPVSSVFKFLPHVNGHKGFWATCFQEAGAELLRNRMPDVWQ